MTEDLPILFFVALIVVFVTLGCTLVAFFWVGRLSVTLRSLLATGLGVAVLIVPVALIADDGEPLMVLFGGTLIVGVVGFPVAFLATRKLDRFRRATESDVHSVFE